jgi:hypothetical protein
MKIPKVIYMASCFDFPQIYRILLSGFTFCIFTLVLQNPVRGEPIKCAPRIFFTDVVKNVDEVNCFTVLESQECQDLKKNLSSEFQKNIISCEPEDVERQSSFMGNSWEKISGCGAGLFEATFGSLGRTIGEGFAKGQIRKEEARACNLDFERKKEFFLNYNRTVPTALKIVVPADDKIKGLSCKGIQEDVIGRHRTAHYVFLNTQISKKKGKNLSLEEQEFLAYNEKLREESIRQKKGQSFSILEAAEKLLKEQGIKLQCYSPKAQAAMICEATGAVLTIAVPALYASRVANLKRLAGLKEEADEMTKLASAAKSEILQVNNTLTDEQRIQKAAETIRRNLNKNEQEGVLAAHNVGESSGHGFGTYNANELREKERILREAGFKTEEISLLMRRGITGKMPRQTDIERIQAMSPSWNRSRLLAENSLATGDKTNAATHFKEAYRQITQPNTFGTNPSRVDLSNIEHVSSRYALFASEAEKAQAEMKFLEAFGKRSLLEAKSEGVHQATWIQEYVTRLRTDRGSGFTPQINDWQIRAILNYSQRQGYNIR